MKPRLVTKAEAKEWMECEACGERAPKRPWPDGWVQCSTSRHLIADYKREPNMTASWCPKHRRGYESPSATKISWAQLLRELRSTRETLRKSIPASALASKAASEVLPPEDAITQEGNGPLRKTDAQGPHIRFSARRTGLVPM